MSAKPSQYRRSVTSLLLLLTLVVPAFGSDENPTEVRDSGAVTLAEKTQQTMGGEAAFEASRLFRFDFVVLRGEEELTRHHHWWDRWTGDYRVEGSTREGAAYRVDFNTNTGLGAAWLDGDEQTGDSLASLLEMAQGRFINDTYWFLMPWKWLDPGVHLSTEAPREIDGSTYDVVQLSFSTGVGLTSGDRYWGLVSRDSGLMERWEYVLQQEDGSAGEAEPRAFEWSDWIITSTGLRLSRVKQAVGGDIAITFPILEVCGDLPEDEIEEFFATDPKIWTPGFNC